MPRTPIAIGGVGGSGTRVVAEILEKAGVFIGDNLNASKDNLDFPGLARFIPSNPNQVARYIGQEEIAAFESRMLHGFHERQPTPCGWGWKLPPTFLFLDHFSRYFPSLRYVHVIRHGLDMAFSRNRNQLRKWGHLFGITENEPSAPRAALHYWIRANEFAISQAERYLKDRFIVLNFNDLCQNPIDRVGALLVFLGIGPEEIDMEALSQLVKPPPSLHRYRNLGNDGGFSEEEISRVERFGFRVTR